ncbi:10683_t:CDS:1, partial [Cetraspora pellucida]
ATQYLDGSYYLIHSLMYHVIKKLKEIFKLITINANELDFEDETDAFNDDDMQNENKINNSINTMGLLNEVKEKIYTILCYYYSDPAPQELISALLDP